MASSTTASSNNVEINSCLVLFATQSGRAKACARRTSRILAERCSGGNGNGTANSLQVTANGHRSVDDRHRGMNDPSKFAAECRASQTLLVLFLSTTGDGEQPDSMQHIWKQLLQKSLPSDLFRGVPVALFCLGDRAYGDQFCAAGRKLAVRLLQLGATLFCNLGYGDDGTPGGGVFVDLQDWLESELLPKLEETGTLPAVVERSPSESVSASPSSSPPVECPYHVNVLSSPPASPLPDSAESEWQQPRYRSSYLEFTDSLKPLTAYAYTTVAGGDGTDGLLASRSTVRRISEADSVNFGPMNAASDNNEGDEEASSSFLLAGRVTRNQRITAEDWEQNTRRVGLQVSLLRGRADDKYFARQGGDSLGRRTAALPYRAGDVAAVLPCNLPEEVERFIRVLPQKLQDVVDHELELEYDNTQDFCFPLWPRRCTLRGWLTLCADIHTLPEREDLRALAAYCTSTPDDDSDIDNSDSAKQQQEKLIALSEPSLAGALYVDYILREKRTWADVLYDFDSLRETGSGLSIEGLLTLLAPIRPREFSIASSPTKQQDVSVASGNDETFASDTAEQTGESFALELCVAVVEGKTPLGRSFHGLCSSYISRLSLNSIVRMWIRPGSFHGLPLDLDNEGLGFIAPALYVGAGTGIAPLRGLIQEREAVRKMELERKGIPENTRDEGEQADLDRDSILFFGCRKEKADFYYESEWALLSTAGRLGLRTAFSQDQWYKIYVQKVLETADEEGKLIAKHILEKNGAIYIAGGPKMARAVKEVIVTSLTQEMDGNEKAAKQVLARLQRLGLYSVESWS